METILESLPALESLEVARVGPNPGLELIAECCRSLTALKYISFVS